MEVIMDELNLTKETALDMSKNPSCFWQPERIESVSKDWLIMFEEITRLTNLIEEIKIDVDNIVNGLK
jgi:hypothetical protein